MTSKTRRQSTAVIVTNTDTDVGADHAGDFDCAHNANDDGRNGNSRVADDEHGMNVVLIVSVMLMTMSLILSPPLMLGVTEVDVMMIR